MFFFFLLLYCWFDRLALVIFRSILERFYAFCGFLNYECMMEDVFSSKVTNRD